LTLLESLENKEQEQFLKWTQTFLKNNDNTEYPFAGNKRKKNEEEEEEEEEKRRDRKSEVLLSCIKETLREKVPLSGAMKSEQISFPTFGEDKHLNASNCLHVDAFLYDDEDVDTLIEEGKIQSNFCTQCNSSTNIQSKTFISHSASKERMKHIFRRCLPSMKGKTILDVGSRLGVVLYVAYTYTEASRIVGVELNKELCDLQRMVVGKYQMDDRVCVREGDVMEMDADVQSADVVVLMNVFEWFLDLEAQKQVWNYLWRNIKRGAVVVASPPIDISLGLIDSEIDFDAWLKRLDTDRMDTEFVEETEFCIYEVK